MKLIDVSKEKFNRHPGKENNERSVIMARVGFFSILGLIGTLAEELNKAAEDNKITITAGLHIAKELCGKIGVEWDDEGLELTKKES